MGYVTEAELQARRTALETKLKDLIDSPRPSYQIGDRRFDWNQYHRMLLDQLKYVNEQLSRLPAWEATIYVDPAESD